MRMAVGASRSVAGPSRRPVALRIAPSASISEARQKFSHGLECSTQYLSGACGKLRALSFLLRGPSRPCATCFCLSQRDTWPTLGPYGISGAPRLSREP